MGLQCPLLVWTKFHAPDSIPDADESLQRIFSAGQSIGLLAQKRYPDGIAVGFSHDNWLESITQTIQVLKLRRSVFEAGFSADHLNCWVDILLPSGQESWDIVEVKSSTRVHPQYIWDVGFQSYVLTQAGIKINSCFCMHINTGYIRRGELDVHELFTCTDITAEVRDYNENIALYIEEIFTALRKKTAPVIAPGAQCASPYQCALHDRCTAHLPKSELCSLYRGSSAADELYAEKTYRWKDIPEDYRLTEKQEIQRAAVLSGKPHIDKDAIREWLSGLIYPLYFFDFETLVGPVPYYDGTRPFMKVPFQYSLHIMDSPSAEPRHLDFLGNGRDDPRLELLVQLKKNIGRKGSIIAYNMAFEIMCLNQLFSYMPKETWIPAVIGRFVDLLQVFRNFMYYHPGQDGSCSLKNVLPQFYKEPYDALGIQDGGTAAQQYEFLIQNACIASEAEEIRHNLLEYCKMDTFGMTVIIKKLYEMSA